MCVIIASCSSSACTNKNILLKVANVGHSPDVVFFRAIPDNDKSNDDRQKEEELLQQIQKLVETRDFLVDDVEFERLRCAFISMIYRWPRLEFFGHLHT